MAVSEEKFEFTWIGKKDSIVEADIPSDKILVSDESSSIDWENTKNIFIEGDNLDGLKLLQKEYANKIKMIYIDPPYNTGKDFVYRDNLKHSDWCSMIYPRLKLARKLLSDDGVIFISIDDNELFNLKLICDEIFGEKNFVNCIAVKMSEATGVKMSHQHKRFPKLKEYILFYKKKSFDRFLCIDKYRHGVWDKENNIFLDNLSEQEREELILYKEKERLSEKDLININKILEKVKMIPLKKKIKDLQIKESEQEEWLFANSYRIVKTVGSSSLLRVVNSMPKLPKQEMAAALSKDNVLFFYITDYNKNTKEPRIRIIFADENLYKNPCDFWQDIKTSGAVALEGDIKYKNGKKPLKMLTRLIKMTTSKDDIILDFFAGSGTTGHAVMEQNSIDSQKRRFILMQRPENLDINYQNTKNETKNDIKECIRILDGINKPHYITELTKERLRRSGKSISEKNKNIDTGFRVYKLSEKEKPLKNL